MENTPWGASQGEEHIADGVTAYTTASHGGLRIEGPAFERLPATFKEVMFLKPNEDIKLAWAEEDCDMPIALTLLGIHLPWTPLEKERRLAIQICKAFDKYRPVLPLVEAAERQVAA